MGLRSLLAFLLLSIAENALATSTAGTGELPSKCNTGLPVSAMFVI